MLSDRPCCPSCSAPYRPGEPSCSACGTLLESVVRQQIDFSDFPPLDPHGPPPRMRLFVLEVGDQRQVRFRGRVTAAVELAEGEYSLGRRDLVNGHYPDIDLQNAGDYGFTSRRHARLAVRDGQLFVTDLKGEDTTAINDPEQFLPEGEERELNEGDRLIIGEAVTFRVLAVDDD